MAFPTGYGSEVKVVSEDQLQIFSKGIFVQEGSSGTHFDHGQFEIKTVPVYSPPNRKGLLYLLRVTIGCILPIGYRELLTWIQTWIFFSIGVKELFEPIVLKKKATGFWSFQQHFFFFFWEIDFWVTLGDFYGKNAKLGREICIWLKNWLRWNEIWCAADNHNVCKRIFRFEL